MKRYCLAFLSAFILDISLLSAEMITSGIIEPYYENTVITATTPGVIAQVFVKNGEKVRKGQNLFQIDDREVKAELAVLQANVSLAKASLQQLEDKLKRIKAVREPKIISKNDLQARENEISIAKARLKSEEAKVKQAELLLNLLTVRSPRYGVVVQNEMQPGIFARPGQAPTMLIADLSKLMVHLELDQEEAQKFNSEMAATAFINNSPPMSLQFVKVESNVKDVDGETKNFSEIFYSFDASRDFPVTLGQSVEVHIQNQNARP